MRLAAMDPVISLTPARNAFLASLPETELKALQPRLESARLRSGQPLYEPDMSEDHIYFPTSGVVSVLYAERSGATTELAQVGRESVVGLSALLGGHGLMLRAVVHLPGAGWRLPAPAARGAFLAGGGFQALALKHALAFMVQLAHTAVCNTHHSVAQRFCRWLLVCFDRVDGDEIRMTQEVIAGILGVRRQGVTEAAKSLEKRGIISYHRGSIRVVDRRALERCACDCYRLVQRETAALFASAPPSAGRGAGAAADKSSLTTY